MSSPDDSKYNNEYNQALNELNQSINLIDYYHYAIDCCNQGMYEKASAYFNKSIELNTKDDSYMIAYRGHTKMRLGLFKEAIEDFNKVLKIDSDYEEYSLTNIGVAKMKLGLYKEAIECLNKALVLAPIKQNIIDEIETAESKLREQQKKIKSEFDK